MPQQLYTAADWVHGVCRELWDVKSFIKPTCRRADGSLGSQWRSGMSPDTLKKAGFGKRWHLSRFQRAQTHDRFGADFPHRRQPCQRSHPPRAGLHPPLLEEEPRNQHFNRASWEEFDECLADKEEHDSYGY
jgi:hypothetical protein